MCVCHIINLHQKCTAGGWRCTRLPYRSCLKHMTTEIIHMYPHLICRSSTNVRCSITRSGSHVVISKTTVFGELTSNSMNSAWRHSCCQVRLLDNFFLWFKPMLSWKQDPRPRWVPPVELKMGGETKNPGEFLRHLGDVHNLEIPNSWFLMENPQNENGWKWMI